jgi:hypothetical protein
MHFHRFSAIAHTGLYAGCSTVVGCLLLGILSYDHDLGPSFPATANIAHQTVPDSRLHDLQGHMLSMPLSAPNIL